MTTLGNKSKTTFLFTEAGKLTVEFEAGATIKKGQPVKLANDGTVTVWAKADLLHTLVGYAYADVASGDLVTVWTRGYAMIFGVSTGALNAGPVAYQGYSTADISGTSGYSQYANSATAAENNAWALDDAVGSGELVRVLLMD